MYAELWEMLKAHPDFSVVKPGNMLRFDRDHRSPLKTQMGTNDYPEVALFTEGSTGNLCNTSSSTMLTRRFSWVISSGDFRYEETLPVEWTIFRAMVNWRSTLATLQWEGKEFVKVLRLADTNFDQVDKSQRRGNSGWVAVWSIEAELHFQTSDLISGIT